MRIIVSSNAAPRVVTALHHKVSIRDADHRLFERRVYRPGQAGPVVSIRDADHRLFELKRRALDAGMKQVSIRDADHRLFELRHSSQAPRQTLVSIRDADHRLFEPEARAKPGKGFAQFQSAMR